MYIDLHQTGPVGKGSDHLQLTKFRPSCAPGKWVCSGATFFGSALLRPACSVCVSLSTFFIITVIFALIGKGQKFWLDAVTAATDDSHGYQRELNPGSLGAKSVAITTESELVL